MSNCIFAGSSCIRTDEWTPRSPCPSVSDRSDSCWVFQRSRRPGCAIVYWQHFQIYSSWFRGKLAWADLEEWSRGYRFRTPPPWFSRNTPFEKKVDPSTWWHIYKAMFSLIFIVFTVKINCIWILRKMIKLHHLNIDWPCWPLKTRILFQILYHYLKTV